MTAYTIRVSQRVFYDVEVEAPSRVEALREVGRSIDPSETTPGPDLDDFPMTERDSGGWEVEPVQFDEAGNPIDDDEFLLELSRIING